jgi:hypothetical protein
MNTAVIEIEDNTEEWCCGDSAEMPKSVTASYKTFGGYTATCSKCNFVCGYWECACELQHDCGEWK